MFRIPRGCLSKQNLAFRLSRYHSKTGCYGFRPKPDKTTIRESEEAIKNQVLNSNLLRLVTAYRKHGHRKADLDPLNMRLHNLNLAELTELRLDLYGLEEADMNTTINLEGIMHLNDQKESTLKEVIGRLEKAYCGQLAVELHHLSDENEKLWLSDLVEKSTPCSMDNSRQKHIAKLLLRSEAFDNFLGRKFMTVKRYSGEGAESMMAFFDEFFLQSSKAGLNQVIMGMQHRGRLNLLTTILKYPVAQMFSKMKGNSELPPHVQATGDVLSHLTSSVDLDYGGQDPLHVTMLPNPSHLEACNPVVAGKARGRQMTLKEGDYSIDDKDARIGDKVTCLLVHGDASFAGQGIVSETLGMVNLPHYEVGGTVHLIVNNQVGFTTPADRARSSLYSSDIAKMIDCPTIHVNGNHPEEVARAAMLALEYRMKYRKDVVVDMFCYRRWGHNELDDPTFTNPAMYSVITNRQSVPTQYANKLTDNSIISHEALKEDLAAFNNMLNDELRKSDEWVSQAMHLEGRWKDMVVASSGAVTIWDTGLPLDTLQFVGAKSVEVPADFNIHSHLKKTHVNARLAKLKEGTGIDWATAEALALGSLLYQGFHARISGQDVGRGTFSHRHAMLIDQKTEEMYIPLNNLREDQTGFLEVCNSHLSEEGVLGFEYGMSIENPNHLIIWEAQFGDFFNGAQIILDTFVSSGETKWLLQSGLVMLLPHGYDGAGPEHSSCRVERFLQMTDSKEEEADGDAVNMHIVNPTTPAQYFHLLRQQMMRNFRKPLIIVAPKLLLRLPAAMSTLHDMSPGTHFMPVIGDTSMNPTEVRRVMFCSGKHYYSLLKRREKTGNTDTAIIRLEALTPFPMDAIRDEMRRYPGAQEFVWSQEEHRNMGAWTFVAPRFQNLLGVKLAYVGRRELAAPAVGIGKLHAQEEEQVLGASFPSKSGE
ncbi:2-oxoadipate dehydrogenase complex component E1 isoform X2 [Nematostella vectensis]|uniref:2-oxoadipate dehydrogenase complex component E1 isoform X2 n=1 Tax=Nematostella vectensis TaxID=45351 RepID=UPI00207712A8|nr:2-oxoadipate dehydrogenase complex component E1 isoform X2 [Nematostella vectensis]